MSSSTTFDNDSIDFPDLGPCCCCGRRQDGSVRTIVMLDFRGPAGTIGWGCLVCGLDNAGATAVVCDTCVDRLPDADVRDRLRWIIGGEYASQGIRQPLTGFAQIPFAHDMTKHSEEL